MSISYDSISVAPNAATTPNFDRGVQIELNDSQWHRGRFLYPYGNMATSVVLVSSVQMEAHSERKFTSDVVVETYRAKTPLGQRLLALRRAYVQQGGILINAESLDRELHRRRGGVIDV